MHFYLNQKLLIDSLRIRILNKKGFFALYFLSLNAVIKIIARQPSQFPHLKYL